MAAILALVLLNILRVGHGMQFDQVTCERFRLDNGVITPDQPHGYLDMETITVTCNAGYELIGKSKITCLEDLGGWDQNRPQCVRGIVQCEYPEIQDGIMSRQSTTGDTQEKETLEVGAIIRPNDVIQFRCGESSHMVIGNKTHPRGSSHSVTCLSTGVWGGPVPTCRYVMCEHFELANGNVAPSQPRGYFDGDSVTVTCDTGYRLSGKSQLSCSTAADGWDHELPTCEQVKCENLDFQNGYAYQRSNDGQRTLLNKTSIIPSNSTVYFQCLRTWRMRTSGTLQEHHHEHKLLCTRDGEWDGQLPTCEAPACDNIAVSNGRVTPAADGGYFTGEMVNVACDQGYKLAGKAQVTCMVTGWNHQPGQCKQVECETLDFQNGYAYQGSNDGQRMLLNKTSIITSNSTVYFRCLRTWRMRTNGTLQEHNHEYKLLCTLNGEWAGQLPTCEAAACDNIAVSNGRVTPAAEGGYFTGEMVNVACDQGYKLAGKGQVTCMGTGWNHQPGECIEVHALTCPKPRFEFGHMTKTYQDGENTLTRSVKPEDVIRAGDIVDFRCNHGYVMREEGDDSLMQGQVVQARCRTNSTWDRNLPTCQLFECSAPPTTPSLKYTLEGQTAHYRCLNDNYELLGPTVLMCRMDLGSWFPHLPTCRRKACPTIRWPEDGLFVRQGRLQNATVTAQCNDAFTLNGTAHRTCLTNGSWSGQPAVCISGNSYCPNPGVPDGGLRDGSEFHVGARVTFSCSMGFILLGEAKQQCLQTGQWSAPAVKCLGPDEYLDPANAANRWIDIINDIESDHSARGMEHHVFFLMDSSGSISNSEINAQRNFIGNLALKLRTSKMSWVAFNTSAFLLAEGQNTNGMKTAMKQQRIVSAGATNVRRAFKKVKEVLGPVQQLNGTKVSIILLLNDHINEGGSLSNAMRMKWAWTVQPRLYVVSIGGYVNRRDLVGAVSVHEAQSHDNAFFMKHKGDLLDLYRGISNM